MNGTILAIGHAVNDKVCEPLYHDLSECGVKPRIIRARVDSTEVTIGNRVFALEPDIDPDGKLSHAQANDRIRAEQHELTQGLVATLRVLTPIAIVILTEDIWSIWGSQLSGVAHMFETALERQLHPYALRFVLHRNQLLEAV